MIDGRDKITAKKLKIDRKQIAILQEAKNQLGLTNDEYQYALGFVGAKSSKDLYLSQFFRLMDYLKNIGFVTAGHMESQKKIRDAIRNGIEEIMGNSGITNEYVDAMIKQMGFTVEHWKWCDADQMEKIIIVLLYRQNCRKTSCGEDPAF